MFRATGRIGAAAFVLLVLTLGACGNQAVLPARSMTVVGTEMAFNAPERVQPGNYQVTFKNAGTVYHELAFKNASGKFMMRRSIAAGQSMMMQVNLPAGTYELGCFEPGHYEGGMHQTLTVADS